MAELELAAAIEEEQRQGLSASASEASLLEEGASMVSSLAAKASAPTAPRR